MRGKSFFFSAATWAANGYKWWSMGGGRWVAEGWAARKVALTAFQDAEGVALEVSVDFLPARRTEK